MKLVVGGVVLEVVVVERPSAFDGALAEDGVLGECRQGGTRSACPY